MWLKNIPSSQFFQETKGSFTTQSSQEQLLTHLISSPPQEMKKGFFQK
jgi:hypothetical protein